MLPDAPLLQRGGKSEAKLAPDRAEIQITRTIESLTVERVKTIDISGGAGRPTALRVIDSRLVAIGYSDGVLKIADLGESCQFVRQYRFATGLVTLDLHDEDDPMIPLLCGVKGPDSAVLLVELQRKQPQVVRFKHSSEVTSLMTLKTGLFATGTKTGEVNIWSRHDFEKPAHSISVSGNENTVNSLAVLSGGKTLLAAFEYGNILVFSTEDEQGRPRLQQKARLSESVSVQWASGFHGNTKFAVFAVGKALTVWNVADQE